MKFTTFRKAEHRVLSAAITEALKDVGDKFNIDINVGGGQIGETGGRVNVEVKIRADATGESPAKKEFEKYCSLYGMKPEHYHATFSNGGTLYRVVGLVLSRPKFPISCERIHDGKSLLFTTDIVRKLVVSPVKAAA